MDLLGPRLGPSSKMETVGVGDTQSSAIPRQNTIDKPQSFSKVLESRKAPQELRPVERRRPEEKDNQATFEDAKAATSGRKTSERETAMLNFMDSMESEFGITPVRMLEALAVLETEELTRPPEETASDVITNLELSPEEEPRAMEMYLGFLQEWRDIPKAPTVAQSLPPEAMLAGGLAVANQPLGQLAAEAGVGKSVLTPSGERRQVLNQSLDRMNDKFFMKAPVNPALAEDSQELTALTNREMRDPLWQKLGLEPSGPNEASPVLPQMTTLEKPPLKMDGLPVAMSEAELLALQSEAPMVTEGGQTADLENLLRQLNADPMAFRAEAKPVAGEPKVLDISALQVPGFGGVAALTPEDSAMAGEMGDSGAEGEPGREGQESQSLNTDFAQMLRAEPGAKASGPVAASGVSAFALTESEAQANLEALKDQTQMMVTKGGGEARIRLNQEGLGEVHLKVLVNEGRVNIELKTDNADTKKLLESSIADLKSSLSSQKLSVDSVKVDVGQSNLSDSQKGMDFQQDMGRQQARQMMNQFRDESASRRDPFFEMSGIKAYGRKRNDLEPIPAAGNIAPRQMNGRGERMNLVA